MSRKPYECYVCQRNGVNNVMVYLAGKDAYNKTIYLEEDGSPHTHKQAKQQQETLSSSSSIEHIHNLLASMDGKLDRLLNLAERK